MPTAITTRICIALFLLATTLATWSTSLDSPAMGQVEAGMKRALASFAVARALNGALSLAQGTEISAGIGANITFSVGQVLDPVNDVVESFSELMLLASVAFGIQKVLLLIGQDVLVKWLLTASLAAWGALRLFSGHRNRWLDAILVLTLMLRFAVPVVTMASDAIYQRFLQHGYDQSTAALAGTTDAMNRTTGDFRAQAGSAAAPDPAAGTTATTDTPQGSQASWWDSLTGSARETLAEVTSAVAGLDPRDYLERLKSHAAAATDHIIELMVVFLLQTLLLPVFLMWALYAVLRGVLAGAFAARGQAA
jgi:hypothetical protein